MKIYYAHPISIYGTNQERRDVDVLTSMGFEVVNPNATEHEDGYHAVGMDYFRHVVQSCQLVAFRAFPDGSIPAGIAKELAFASSDGLKLPIIELPSAISRRTLTVEETREVLFESGCR